MLDIEKLLEGGNFALGAIIFQLVVIPASAGAIASLLLWRRKLGHINVQRMLVHDDSNSRPIWKLIATSSGRSVNSCKIRVGRQFLFWEGVDSLEIDIGDGGMAIASIPFKIEPGTTVTVKSGSFPIYHNNFGSIKEVCMSK